MVRFLNFLSPHFHIRNKDNNTFFTGLLRHSTRWLGPGTGGQCIKLILFLLFLLPLLLFSFIVVQKLFYLKGGVLIYQNERHLKIKVPKGLFIMVSIWKIYGRIQNFGDTQDGLSTAPWDSWVSSSHTMPPLISAGMFLILADIHPYVIINFLLTAGITPFSLFISFQNSWKPQNHCQEMQENLSFCLFATEEIDFSFNK